MPLIHIIINVLLVLFFGGVGYLLSRNEKSYTRFLLVLILIFIGSKIYILTSRPDIMTKILPCPWIIFYFNLYPMAAAAFIPVVIKLAKGDFLQKVRVVILCFFLFILTLIPYRYFLLEAAESNKNIFDENGICMQSSPDTCSAAAAVTLLRLYDIEATEAKVVRLALTKKEKGTDRLGLYRALFLLTENQNDFFVNMKKISVEKLIERNTPALITVGLDAFPSSMGEMELERIYKWRPGSIHDVVFLGTDDKDESRVLIGEPQFGLEKWPKAHLEILFQEMAVYLEDEKDGEIVNY
jgi:hypothetical protein